MKNRNPILIPALALIAVLFLPGCSSPAPAPPTPTPAPWEREGWELVWQDEFAGTELDREQWAFDTGGGGWGNNEWQYYTDRPENAYIENEILVIEAREEDFGGRAYTSARLKTQGLNAWTYGRIEARLKLPSGQGIWSAFWLLGENITSAGWPQSGEIDIMENIGQPGTLYGTVHGPGYSGGNGVGAPYSPPGNDLSADFHVYAIEWAPGEIRWYLDDQQFLKITDRDVPGEWVYNHPFFIIINLAVGGNWPGYPNESTIFPQRLYVDYVRIYRDPTLDLEAIYNTQIHLAEINLELAEAGEDYQATAYVTVLDQDGQPVPDVVVSNGWLGVKAGADEGAKTNAEGIAGPFVAVKTKLASQVSFCVTNLSGGRYAYDKAANTSETCVSAAP